MKKIVRDIRALAKSLEAREDIDLQEHEIGAPASPEHLAALEGKIPEEMLAFLAQADGLTLRWRFHDQPEVWGVIKIYPSHPASIWQTHDYGFEDPAIVFDMHTEESYAYWVHQQDGSWRLEWARSGEEGVGTVFESLAGYLKKGLAASFARGWVEDDAEEAIRMMAASSTRQTP